MHLHSNPELELAYEYVCFTNQSIFLTGRAGTGKTTFLHRIREEAVKRMVVVAPTGVAAINAGGMTIHSFFQLPFGPYLPGNARESARQRKFSGQKIKLIRSLDLVVIDEISMVRADLLDGIDEVLRRYKNPLLPFGGVQLLMIGDLHQLPPVAKEEEWSLLRDHYQTPYFFSSYALRKTEPEVVELKHIYRQSDQTFIDLLNRVRNNRIDADLLATLNNRFQPHFQPPKEDGYIILTTHNASAQAINAEKLAAIPGRSRLFKATVTGDFPAHAFPTDEDLELKVGAQVMFVRNDPTREKRYFNGRIGTVTRIEQDDVYVRCPGDDEEIAVAPSEWTNLKYTVDRQTKEVAEETIGTFAQLPLKLAWAITIHKSQGLTFERVILDAQAAFAHGQVYVALSRCKSFEGIVLSSKITPSGIRTDTTIRNFTETAQKNAPDQARLEQAKMAFQQSQILNLFDFSVVRTSFEKLKRALLEHENSLQPGAYQPFKELFDRFETGVATTAQKFKVQLHRYFQLGRLPEANGELQDRLRKAAAWFVEQLESDLAPAARDIQVITDNRMVRKTVAESLENLQKELFVKIGVLNAARTGFSTREYLRTKARAELDFQSASRKPQAAADTLSPRDTPHPDLYARLLQWRRDIAGARGVELYKVLPTRSLLELAQTLPGSKAELKKIKGIGKTRIEQYGADLLALIDAYCRDHQIERIPLVLPEEEEPKKPPKPNTKIVSFELFRSGKSIDEIAAERALARSTIEGHLTHFISLGELSIFDLVEKNTVKKIEDFLITHPNTPFSEIKAHFGEACTYGEIRMVRAHFQATRLDIDND